MLLMFELDSSYIMQFTNCMESTFLNGIINTNLNKCPPFDPLMMYMIMLKLNQREQ